MIKRPNMGKKVLNTKKQDKIVLTEDDMRKIDRELINEFKKYIKKFYPFFAIVLLLVIIYQIITIFFI
jgi:hypothetical protein